MYIQEEFNVIQLKRKVINNIPVIELVDGELVDEKLPLVVFFHGWTNVKESVLVNGYELAKRGIRAILPDSIHHGERDPEGNATDNQLIFWDVVMHNVEEFKPLTDYYVEKNLADRENIGVSGFSMGGITTAAVLTQYDWVKAAVVLEGTPSPIPFTYWLLNNSNPANSDNTALNGLNKNEVDLAMEALRPISLDLNPGKIANRPVHFWHGTEDESVPFDMTQDFVTKTQAEPYGRHLSFSIGEGIKHKVPYEVTVEMADFFKKKL